MRAPHDDKASTVAGAPRLLYGGAGGVIEGNDMMMTVAGAPDLLQTRPRRLEGYYIECDDKSEQRERQACTARAVTSPGTPPA